MIDRTAQLSTFMRRFADVFRLPPPHTRPCDLIAVLKDIVRLAAARPDAGDITWKWDLEKPSVYVEIDRGLMEQALLNIVKNAIEAVGGEGTVTLRVTSADAGSRSPQKVNRAASWTRRALWVAPVSAPNTIGFVSAPVV
ncbi:hypothetical protein BH24ACI4_BH24ACI4_23640 [soil metagenome]